MGIIKKTLATRTLDELPFFHDKLRIEKESDGYHFHWRDLRVICDLNQAVTMSTGIHGFFCGLNLSKKKYDADIPGEIMLGDKAAVELLIDGNIHFHYRDVRLELSQASFLELANLFNNAAEEIKNEKNNGTT